jgi:cytochrome P450
VATEPAAPDGWGPLDDLYRLFAERRRDSPVWGESLAPGTSGGVTLYGFEDCARVLRDPATFSSRGYMQSIDLVMGRTILSMDDPDHKRHRDLVASAFRQKELSVWGGETVPAICDELIDRFQQAGRADLVHDFSGEFTMRVTARILGLPEDDHAQFQRLSTELIHIADDIETGFAASGALRDYFAEIVAERRASPREDLVSNLVTAEVGGEHLDDEAIFSFLRLLMPAGVETTATAIPNLLHLLLTHPDQLRAVTEDRSLVGPAIEESLRIAIPLLYIARMTTREVEIGGVHVPANSWVSVCLASANRDETRWPDPEHFDIHRPAQQHLSFAAGPHMCLGQQLARMEITMALNALLDRLPNLRGDPDAIAPRVVTSNGGTMPALDSLPVVFDASAA